MDLKVTLLGTGTSGGVPSIGCDCEVCRSVDARDKRMRCAAILESGDTRILVDCGPDIRQQLLSCVFRPIDGLLITHSHYDHIGGLDDLRPFCVFGDINVYCDNKTVARLHQSMPYCFGEHLYPGVPKILLHEVVPHRDFRIGNINIMPIKVMHDRLEILGFRLGTFAYITDMKTIPDTEYEYLEGVKVLVVNALRFKKEHHSHQLVGDAVRFSRKIGAEHTYLIHMNHDIGLHCEASKLLPDGVEFAYDGMSFNVSSFE